MLLQKHKKVKQIIKDVIIETGTLKGVPKQSPFCENIFLVFQGKHAGSVIKGSQQTHRYSKNPSEDMDEKQTVNNAKTIIHIIEKVLVYYVLEDRELVEKNREKILDINKKIGDIVSLTQSDQEQFKPASSQL